MKIRIQNNTVRVRLNDREVEALYQGRELVSQTWFPGNNLSFLLQIGQGNTADFVGHTINITVNKAAVERWARSSEVAIAMAFDAPNDENLSILVEKDMKM